MEEEKKKEKTVFDLKMHETLVIVEKLPLRAMQSVPDEKRYEVTRVPGGWVYAFEYIGFRQSPIVFVPLVNDEFAPLNLNLNGRGK